MDLKDKQLKSGINQPIICSKCGHKVGYVRLKPALYKMLENKNKAETWTYIFAIALATQIISQIISDLLLNTIHFR